MNNLISFLERETGLTVNTELLQEFITANEIDPDLIYFTFITSNRVSKNILLDIYKNKDIWEVAKWKGLTTYGETVFGMINKN